MQQRLFLLTTIPPALPYQWGRPRRIRIARAPIAPRIRRVTMLDTSVHRVQANRRATRLEAIQVRGTDIRKPTRASSVMATARSRAVKKRKIHFESLILAH